MKCDIFSTRNYKFKDVCTVLNGRAYLLPELQSQGKYPILRVGNFFTSDKWYYSDMELPDDKYCVNGDLLFAWSASFGPKIWQGEKVIYHYHIWKLLPKEDIADKFYLYYWLRHSVNTLTAGLHGSVMAHMTKRDMEEQAISLPPLPIQRKIASILSSLDDKIDTNRRINENLEAQARAIFKSWFVDFEPFGGKMPEGWRIGTLSEIADFVSGYAYTSKDLQPSKSAMATIKNFDRNGGFKMNGYKEIIPQKKVKPEQYVSLYDILVAHTDLTQKAEVAGNAEIVTSLSTYESVVYSMDLVKVIPKENQIPRFVLASMLKDPRFKNHCLEHVNGSTVLHLSKKALPSYPIVFPTDITTILPLEDALFSIFHLICKNTEESRTLATLRDALLPKLMSGEIDVSEAEIMVQ